MLVLTWRWYMRLTVEIPDEEHVFLKMCCAKLKKKIKDFCGEAIIHKIHEWEDKWDQEGVEEEDYDINDKTQWTSLDDLEKELAIGSTSHQEQGKEISKNSFSTRKRKNYSKT